MPTIVVTGAGSGLGKEICLALNDIDTHYIIGLDKKFPAPSLIGPGLSKIELDLESPIVIADFCSDCADVDILINCAGINEINSLEDLTAQDWDRVMNVNARAIMLMSQGLLLALKQTKGTILNIISNASHMPMTASLIYNASKGAAHIMTLQMARELTKAHGITLCSAVRKQTQPHSQHSLLTSWQISNATNS